MPGTELLIKLAYTHLAQSDLVDFHDRLFDQAGSSFAEAGLAAMIARCEDLSRYPDMGRRRTDLDAFGLSTQSISEGGRVIVYTRRGDTLHVVRVLGEEPFS